MQPLSKQVVDKAKSLEVSVDLTDKVVTDEEAEEIMKANGLAVVQKNNITKLAQLGIYLHGVGVMRMQRGRALMSQERLDQASAILFRKMNEVANDPEAKGQVQKLTALAQSLGYLATKITQSQEVMMLMEGQGKPAIPPMPQDEPTARAAPIGSVVGPSTVIMGKELHVHTDPRSLSVQKNVA